MRISTDQDITGEIARQMRRARGLSQPAFWGPVGVRQPAASYYENGRAIPASVRKLLFIRYVAGIEHDPQTKPGADELRKLAAQQPHN